MPMPHTLRTLSPRCATRRQPLLGGQEAAPSPGASPARARAAPRAVGCGARGAQRRQGMSAARPHGSPAPHGAHHRGAHPYPHPHVPTSGTSPPAQNVGATGAAAAGQGGAQAPCTPWLQGAAPRDAAVRSPWRRASPPRPALPPDNTCAGRSEPGNPPLVPPGGSAAGPNNGRHGQPPPGCACASSAMQHRRPRGTARPALPILPQPVPRGGAVLVALGSSLARLRQGPGTATLGHPPRWDLPGSAGIPTRDPAGSSPGTPRAWPETPGPLLPAGGGFP